MSALLHIGKQKENKFIKKSTFYSKPNKIFTVAKQIKLFAFGDVFTGSLETILISGIFYGVGLSFEVDVAETSMYFEGFLFRSKVFYYCTFFFFESIAGFDAERKEVF